MKKDIMAQWLTKPMIILFILCSVSAAMSGTALANKAESRITAEAQGDDNYKIIISVVHDGNNVFHYTNRVKLFLNGQEVKTWEYSYKNRPPSENFEVSMTLTIKDPATLTSQANCNIHGSSDIQGKVEINPAAGK